MFYDFLFFWNTLNNVAIYTASDCLLTELLCYWTEMRTREFSAFGVVTEWFGEKTTFYGSEQFIRANYTIEYFEYFVLATIIHQSHTGKNSQ